MAKATSAISSAVSVCSHKFTGCRAAVLYREIRCWSGPQGLHNFNAENVAKVVTAAEEGFATHVDIACDADLAASLTSLPICVSSIEPEAFVPAVEAGAHMVELGNYDGLYSCGRVFSAEEVIDLTKGREACSQISSSLSPFPTHTLDEHVRLAELLEEEGADLIQTEGGTSSSPSKPGVHGLIEKADPTLAAAYSISRAVKIPVICASGLSVVTTPMAITAGTAGVGIGAAVDQLNDQLAMIAAVRSIADSLGLPSRPSTIANTTVPQTIAKYNLSILLSQTLNRTCCQPAYPDLKYFQYKIRDWSSKRSNQSIQHNQ